MAENNQRKPMLPKKGENEADRAEAARQKPELKPAEERGERLDTGKAIARGGKEAGHVPGAEPGDE